MPAKLQFIQQQNFVCLFDNSGNGYEIVYPFYGSSPSVTPTYTAIYTDRSAAVPTIIGQYDNYQAAQKACQDHYNQTHP